jgi:hypothetical protein
VLASARANGRGRFSRTFTAGAGKGKLYFAALFPGSSAYLWSISRQILVGINEPAVVINGQITGVLAGPSIAPRLHRWSALALVRS